MKKKIGIMTFVNADNNGAFLQTYALQTYLEKLGYDVEQMVPNDLYIDKNLKKEKKEQLKKYINYRSKFIHFINDDISTSFKKYIAYSKYYAVITGSDQVWNKNLTGGVFDKDFFLATVPSTVRRISYAASIGDDQLYNEYTVEQFESMLKSIDNISLREESARKFLSENITYRNVDRHIDPTLLLDINDYEPLMGDCKLELNEKYIFLFLVGANERIINYTKKLSEKYNLKVIHNHEPGTFKNEKCLLCSVGEFLGYIKNAEIIVTASFHGIIFSLLMNKKVVPFTVKRPIRVLDLMNLIKLSDLVNPDEIIDIEKYNIDYDSINKIIKKERKKSHDYLISAIEGNAYFDDSFLKVGNKYSCYGCGLCESICPKNAITMIEDDEGFLYPSIDKDKCINCGLCEKKCIYKSNKLINTSLNRNVYCGYYNDENALTICTSGGICKALSDYVLNNKGYIVGVRYDENLIPYYDITNNREIAEMFRGSKYILPKINNIYEKTKEKLNNGKLVLFVGSSCIVAALKKYLGKNYDNLLTVDFICHGYPSSKVFSMYKRQLEKKYNKKIVDINFRYKSEKGWDSPHLKLVFSDGEELIDYLYINEYYKLFGGDLIQKKSCYNCEFFLFNKPSDITVCDYWGIRKDKHLDMYNQNKGLSGIMINTKHGEEIFNKISKKIVVKEISLEDMFEGNLQFPIGLKEERIKFFEDIKNPPIDVLVNHYIKPGKKRISKSRAIFRIIVPLELREKMKKIIKK